MASLCTRCNYNYNARFQRRYPVLLISFCMIAATAILTSAQKDPTLVNYGYKLNLPNGSYMYVATKKLVDESSQQGAYSTQYIQSQADYSNPKTKYEKIATATFQVSEAVPKLSDITFKPKGDVKTVPLPSSSVSSSSYHPHTERFPYISYNSKSPPKLVTEPVLKQKHHFQPMNAQKATERFQHNWELNRQAFGLQDSNDQNRETVTAQATPNVQYQRVIPVREYETQESHNQYHKNVHSYQLQNQLQNSTSSVQHTQPLSTTPHPVTQHSVQTSNDNPFHQNYEVKPRGYKKEIITELPATLRNFNQNKEQSISYQNQNKQRSFGYHNQNKQETASTQTILTHSGRNSNQHQKSVPNEEVPIAAETQTKTITNDGSEIKLIGSYKPQGRGRHTYKTYLNKKYKDKYYTLKKYKDVVRHQPYNSNGEYKPVANGIKIKVDHANGKFRKETLSKKTPENYPHKDNYHRSKDQNAWINYEDQIQNINLKDANKDKYYEDHTTVEDYGHQIKDIQHEDLNHGLQDENQNTDTYYDYPLKEEDLYFEDRGKEDAIYDDGWEPYKPQSSSNDWSTERHIGTHFSHADHDKTYAHIETTSQPTESVYLVSESEMQKENYNPIDISLKKYVEQYGPNNGNSQKVTSEDTRSDLSLQPTNQALYIRLPKDEIRHNKGVLKQVGVPIQQNSADSQAATSVQYVQRVNSQYGTSTVHGNTQQLNSVFVPITPKYFDNSPWKPSPQPMIIANTPKSTTVEPPNNVELTASIANPQSSIHHYANVIIATTPPATTLDSPKDTSSKSSIGLQPGQNSTENSSRNNKLKFKLKTIKRQAANFRRKPYFRMTSKPVFVVSDVPLFSSKYKKRHSDVFGGSFGMRLGRRNRRNEETNTKDDEEEEIMIAQD